MEKIEKIYSIKRVGELNKFIGVNIVADGKDIYLTQQDSMKRLEKLFGEEVKKMRNYDIPARPNDDVI
jgi:hypothetical protein